MEKQSTQPKKIRWQYAVWLATLQITTLVISLGFYYMIDASNIVNTGLNILIAMLGGLAFIVFTSIVFAGALAQPLEKMQDKLYELQTFELTKGDKPPLQIAKANELINAVNYSLDQLVEKTTSKNSKALKIKSHLEALVDHMSIGIVVLNPDRTINTYNHAAQIIMGTNGSEALGQEFTSVAKATMLGREFISDWLDNVEQNEAKADAHWVDVELTDKNGQRRYLEIVAHYSKADSNGLETTMLIIDRTGQQQAEDRKVDFIAIAAHELRAPITVIRGYLQVFEDEIGEKLTDEQKSFMQKMHVSAEQLADFINNILHVSKIEQGEISAEQKETDWNEVVSEQGEMLKLRAESHEKSLELKLADDLPRAAVDVTLIPLVLNNLVDNAIKYTRDDGKVTVTTKYNETDGTVETYVEDNGIGIPGSVVGNLFTKFYRSHRSKRQFGGSGIGLFLSKSIVDAHGGKIWVTSKENKGSTFAFSLPTWDSFAKDQAVQDNKEELTKTGHGWIKNHSMYRR